MNIHSIVLPAIAVAAIAMTPAQALAAGYPGLSPLGPSPGLAAPGAPSPAFGSPGRAPLSPSTPPAPSTPRPSFAPIAPIGRVQQPAPLEPFKPFQGRSTYDRPAAKPGYPAAPKPPGYISPY